VFVSANRVLNSMSAEYKNACELASLHSVSKGLLGECGLRGGYMYVHNFNPEITNQLVKLKSINLCSNSIGQLMVDLMCNPPLKDVQESTRVAYQREYKALFDSLKKRAVLVTNFLRGM
jgi:aspartate/methionine/tyrosine aminotransferase